MNRNKITIAYVTTPVQGVWRKLKCWN